MLPLNNKPSFLHVSIQAHVPNSSRLISNFTTGISRPALFSDTREMVALPTGSNELAPPQGVLSGRTTPNYNTTPTSSPIIKRGILGHRRKASNGGLEREEHASTSLMDSLNLDPPLLNARANSSTLPNLGGRSSPSSSSHKYGSLIRSAKKTKGSGYPKNSGLAYDDVIFGLDKRASVRSDPGDREQGERGKFRLPRSHVGGSSHTSPTSSVTTISAAASDSTQPISIPHSSHLTEHEVSGSPIFKIGSDSLKSQGFTKNASSQNRGSKGRGNITKGNISLPKGPLYKEVVHKKVKVVGEFVFEYSGGEGVAQGYYREVEANISVVIRTCIMFEQFDIGNSDK